MISESRLLAISPRQLGAFYILLAAVWLGESIYEFIHHNVSSGLLLLLFGSLFLTVLYLIQRYFTKMLMLYQKNLNNSAKKYKK